MVQMIESWNLQPRQVLLHPDAFRELLVYSYMQEGCSEEEALSMAEEAVARIRRERAGELERALKVINSL